MGSSPNVHDVVQSNLAEIRLRMAAACRRAGRSPDSVRLVAVTKYAEMSWVSALVAQGHRDLGESRPQQLAARASAFPPNICWHLIGHLQRNKVRLAIESAQVLHSIDSVRLLDRVGRMAAELGRTPQILLEVNVSGESSKDGFSPADLRAAWPQIVAVPHIDLAGLMTMAPHEEDPERARPVFQALRELRDELATEERPLPELSMGMSDDFEIAIEEGATIIRIGSRLFAGCDACPLT